MADTFNVTVKQFVDSVLTNLRNNAGSTNTFGATYSQSMENFLIGWSQQEGGGVTNAAKFNPLNTAQEETGSVSFTTGQPGSGVQSYPNSATGVNATVHALQNGRYNALVNALTTNDEGNLGFTGTHRMANDIARELSTWSGHGGIINAASNNYINAIMHNAGISNPSIVGGFVSGLPSGQSQAAIDAYGAKSLGQSITGTGQGSGSTSPWTLNDGLKIAGGVFLIFIATALFIKSQFPTSGIAKALPIPGVK